MKLAHESDQDKLRGGFYTPSSLVQLCLHRVKPALQLGESLRVLEPSCGDGAFIRGFSTSHYSRSIRELVGIEIDDREAFKSIEKLRDTGLRGRIINDDAIHFLASNAEPFDIAVGNPPFVRYQYAKARVNGQLEVIAEKIGTRLMGVSNLWIPIFLGAINSLREGGAFSFVLPSEVLTGISGNVVRQWLVQHTSGLVIDLFPPKTFPNVLQEVIVVSGVKRPTSSPNLRFVQHYPDWSEHTWEHRININVRNWTRYLLNPIQVEAVDVIEKSPLFRPLDAVAKLEVSIVTGANDFFTVSESEAAQFGLETHIKPLLPRIRFAPGLSFTDTDFSNLRATGEKSWLLDLNGFDSSDDTSEGVLRYLDRGIDPAIETRYKTRIRDPWYAVPSIWAGDLLLSKRSHDFPRLVFNPAKVLTTDTIYRGRMREGFNGLGKGLVAGFHNSATLLSAELEGRSFGGGVLELVPSELSRLIVPLPTVAFESFDQLDRIYRQAGGNKLIEQTDYLIYSSSEPEIREIWHTIRDAHKVLQRRRFQRN